LPQLESLGVSSIIIPQILEANAGKGTTNFTNIDPVYGNFESFAEIVNKFHEKGSLIAFTNRSHSV